MGNLLSWVCLSRIVPLWTHLCFPFWGDRLVLQPSRKRKDIADIQSWSQAFAIFTLVLTSYFPYQSSDLLRYQLIILRSKQQFGGVAWLNHDRAFRREAAALRLGDWPHLNADLYHFHTRTGVASASSSSTSPIDIGEAWGTFTSTFLCRSWNLGQCSSQFRRCRFRHSCDFHGSNEMHRRTRHHSSSSVPRFLFWSFRGLHFLLLSGPRFFLLVLSGGSTFWSLWELVSVPPGSVPSVARFP